MTLTRADFALLACPRCRGPLAAHGGTLTGTVRCAACEDHWPIHDGIPNFVEEHKIRGVEWLARVAYDLIAPWHDPSITWLLPLMQGATERTARDGYMRRLALDELADVRHRPVRILDVGIGGGGSLPFLERHLPPDIDVEVWGIDLSEGMMAQCRRRVARSGRHVRLLLGDAHDLPFVDGAFDRVFHVGGIATYRDPSRALREMARVARPGTPIVVVDEQLDPAVGWNPYYWFVFRAITVYDPAPRAPTDQVPDGAVDVLEEQVSNFYYCLSFRVPGDAGLDAPATPPPG